jgi:hypothetical protein
MIARRELDARFPKANAISGRSRRMGFDPLERQLPIGMIGNRDSIFRRVHIFHHDQGFADGDRPRWRSAPIGDP